MIDISSFIRNKKRRDGRYMDEPGFSSPGFMPVCQGICPGMRGPVRVEVIRMEEKQMRLTCRKDVSVLATIIVFCLVFLLCLTAFARDGQARERSAPERGFDMYFTYPEIIVPQGTSSIDVELSFKNTGKRDETIHFDLGDIPDGWAARIKSYAFDITATRLPEGEERLTTLTLEPELGVQPGVYHASIEARTGDGAIQKSETIQITIRPTEEVKGTIEVVSSYPVLQGASDAAFEFSLSITNRTRKEQTFNLMTEAPRDWQVNFMPPFKDRYVSSVIMNPDEKSSVNVEVVPSRFAQAEEYEIPVRVTAGDIEEEITLTVIITGTYSLRVTTPTGLLSLETVRGKPVDFTIQVRNTGSATIRDIDILPMHPENWEVNFDPETIASLAPGSTRQVDMTIVSADQALVGDYALGVRVAGERSSDELELRVTVKASAAWGWIGIAIILLVVGGLLGLFITLGRR